MRKRKQLPLLTVNHRKGMLGCNCARNQQDQKFVAYFSLLRMVERKNNIFRIYAVWNSLVVLHNLRFCYKNEINNVFSHIFN